jgi:hypothetical protein
MRRLWTSPYKLYDSGGLYLMISTSGAKLWRFKYRFRHAERLLVLGKYAYVTLKRAREARDAAHRLLADDIDPAIHKQAQKRALMNSFGEIALEWLQSQRHAFAPKTFAKAEWTVNDLLIPFIGKRPIIALTHPELLNVFGGWKSAVGTRPPTVRASAAVRSFATPSQRVEPRVT